MFHSVLPIQPLAATFQ